MMEQSFPTAYELDETLKKLAVNIKLIVFDVDGVLTDGRLLLGDDGQEYKAFNTRDGHGMKMLQKTGVEISVITGRTSRVVEKRMTELGIKYVYQGCQDKLPAFQELLSKLDIEASQSAFVGDDVVDLPIMLKVGLAVAVSDAHELAKKHAHWITPSAGGRGAAREVCEMLMQAQGTFEAAVRRYL